MKKLTTLVFAALIAVTLSMPAWSQAATPTPKPPISQKDKKEDKREARKDRKEDKKEGKKDGKKDRKEDKKEARKDRKEDRKEKK